MSVDIDMDGLDRQFLEIAARTRSGGKKAAKVVAESVVAPKLKENTPYEERSDRKWAAQRVRERVTGVSKEFNHMKDDIEVSGPNELGQYTVHYGEDTAWRSHFVNDGTIYQKPQHFAEKTEVETRSEARAIMQGIIDEELRGV
ncbi:head-tail adaptor protein [Pullulanibacillus sp. KACC 23026]|uniref:HK97-gp10 family putative phage morphogenesis protein n=1 Tax=Pullulanibacillus sp. KACC 23026 TaxID=3028315 RepID=UPI0023B10118|nr:HK97-gp10 family putative phage morphogenesis protein [Pullulanibacillus sp. KACC 23026]WEG14153.1 head-tail adaptor protein [Pullulanibacillus sp. KACC 23026]